MRLGVVGGSSLVTFDPQNAFQEIGLRVASEEDLTQTTEYGKVFLRKVELKGDGVEHTIIFMQRHSHGADGLKTGITPPHKINYHANMLALKEQGVDAIIATTSVGTIRAEFPPGRVGVANQYIDFTGAATTYHHENAKFTSVTEPFSVDVNAALLKTLRRVQQLDADAPLEFTLWLSTGPQYETAAEVTAAERLGADVVGMTAPREAKLCAELAVPYAALTIASNWAA